MKKYILSFLIIPLLFGSCFESALEEKVYSDVSSEIFEDSKESAALLVDGTLSTLNQGQFFQYGSYFKTSETPTVRACYFLLLLPYSASY